VADCVAELQHRLAERGLALLVRTGALAHWRTATMPQALQALRLESAFTQQLFNHEVAGPGWRYLRDLTVAEWCSSHGVN